MKFKYKEKDNYNCCKIISLLGVLMAYDQSVHQGHPALICSMNGQYESTNLLI